MNRIHVKSSNIKSVGYEESNKTLEIEFNNGGIYQYFKVPVSNYKELMKASSHGKYFISFIKDRFPTEKVK